jgi:exosortase
MLGSKVLKNAGVFVFIVLGLIGFWGVFKSLLVFSLNSGVYTYIPWIPLVSLYLIYSRRATIFATSDYSLRCGLVLVGVSMVIYKFGKALLEHPAQQDHLSVLMLSAVLFILGGFVLFYGGSAFRAASFPLLLLLLVVPLPSLLLDKLIHILQMGSAGAVDWILAVARVPYAREGVVFSLPGLSIEVAEECSGIRSGLALFITSLLAAHLFLRQFKYQVMLILAVLPITVFKNGLRIATLTLIGAFWDKDILASDLHRKGGIPFFLLSLMMMGLLLWGLRKLDRRHGQSAARGQGLAQPSVPSVTP